VISLKRDPLSKARNYAFLLLKFRLRSEREIYERLKRKKFADTVIRETLSFLKERGFLDDNLFAKNWIESRLKKPLGIKKIREELKAKGINKQIIDAQLGRLPESYSEEEAVRNLAAKRLESLKGVDTITRSRRLYGYLARRGFSSEVVTDIVNELK